MSTRELSEFAQRRLRVRGMDVRVFESGVDAGAAFVLIHGFGVSSRYFSPLATDLSTRGRVLVLDLPGFGRTRDPDHSPRITGFAHVVNEIIQRLEVRNPVLVGHSMGAQVAVEALNRAPGLSRGAVLGAPVVNDRERNGALVLWRFVQSAVKEPPSSAWDSVRGFLQTTPSWLLRNFGPMLRYRIKDHIQQTAAPLVVVGGAGDRIAPPDWCRRLAMTRDGIDVVIVEGAAHEMIHTNASEVAHIAAELARRTAAPASHPHTGAAASATTTPGLPPCGG